MQWVRNADKYNKMISGEFKVAAMSEVLAEILCSFGNAEYVHSVLTKTLLEYFFENRKKAAEIDKGVKLFYTTGKPYRSGDHYNVPFSLFHE